MSNAEQDYYAEIVELRAALEQVRGERDALLNLMTPPDDNLIEGWSQIPPHWMAYMRRLEGWLVDAKAERDAALAAAARYKRRAEAVYRYWCSYWGSRTDWSMLRDVLSALGVSDE